jgi:hypothetical protein
MTRLLAVCVLMVVLVVVKGFHPLGPRPVQVTLPTMTLCTHVVSLHLLAQLNRLTRHALRGSFLLTVDLHVCATMMVGCQAVFY